MAEQGPIGALLAPLLTILNGVATTGKTPAERILGLVLLVVIVGGLVALTVMQAPAAVDGGTAGLGLLLLHEWGKD